MPARVVELAPHAQPRAARHPRRLRGGSRLAAGRGGLRRRRDPVRADRGRPHLHAAVLLPPADAALPRGALELARPPAHLRGGAAGHDGPARPAELPARPRPPAARLGPALAGRRGAERVPDRDVGRRERLRVRPPALRGGVRGARGRGLCRLRAVARRHPCRRARDRVRGGRARRGPDARARRRAPGRPGRAARRRVRDRRGARARGRHAQPRAGRPAAAPAPDRAAAVGRLRARARPDRVGAHRRRAVARDPARDRPAPRDRRLPAGARGGGPAARVLLARVPPHAARRRAGVGAAPLRARLRARHGARGADRLAAVRPRAARRPRQRAGAAVGAAGRDLRGARRSAGSWSRACAARSRWSAA